LNFFSKLLLVRKVKSGALIGQKRVKLERELRGLVIPIFHIPFQSTSAAEPVLSISVLTGNSAETIRFSEEKLLKLMGNPALQRNEARKLILWTKNIVYTSSELSF
jgi:hypothetical protein